MGWRALVTVLAALVVTAAPTGAQMEPTISDIAACNHEAAARTAHPGALPGPQPGGGTVRGIPDAREGGPATGRSEQPSPQPRGPALDPPAGGGVGQKTDPSGSIITQSPDPLLKGMDAERASDPAYRAAYRACMQGRSRAR